MRAIRGCGRGKKWGGCVCKFVSVSVDNLLPECEHGQAQTRWNGARTTKRREWDDGLSGRLKATRQPPSDFVHF